MYWQAPITRISINSTILVLPPSKPALTNHTASVSVNGRVTVNVLSGAGGYDIDTLSILSGPSHGTAVDPPGDITYTPGKGYTGMDSLVYQLCAPLDNTICSQATLAFTVATSPDTGFGTPRPFGRSVLFIGTGSIIMIGAGVYLSFRSKRAIHSQGL